MLLEGSHSGLVRSLGKRVCLNRHREFESRPFRRIECPFERSGTLSRNLTAKTHIPKK